MGCDIGVEFGFAAGVRWRCCRVLVSVLGVGVAVGVGVGVGVVVIEETSTLPTCMVVSYVLNPIAPDANVESVVVNSRILLTYKENCVSLSNNF